MPEGRRGWSDFPNDHARRGNPFWPFGVSSQPNVLPREGLRHSFQRKQPVDPIESGLGSASVIEQNPFRLLK